MLFHEGILCSRRWGSWPGRAAPRTDEEAYISQSTGGTYREGGNRTPGPVGALKGIALQCPFRGHGTDGGEGQGKRGAYDLGTAFGGRR